MSPPAMMPATRDAARVPAMNKVRARSISARAPMSAKNGVNASVTEKTPWARYVVSDCPITKYVTADVLTKAAISTESMRSRKVDAMVSPRVVRPYRAIALDSEYYACS